MPTTLKIPALLRVIKAALVGVVFAAEVVAVVDLVALPELVVAFEVDVVVAGGAEEAGEPVGPAVEALVTPLICACTTGLNCPDIFESLVKV